MHRPSNVDHANVLASLLGVLREIFRIHSFGLLRSTHAPKAISNVFGLQHLIDTPRMIMLPPQGYLEMLGLMAGARIVLTDSGGLQEETTALGVPCLTMRENTERPING
jgi:UDP-N-acetylglucosamine 2-epimerase (non-hydrolysing)